MRVLVLLFLLNTSFASAAMLNDSTSIVKNQPDSVTKKVVYLLLKAWEYSPEKPHEALKSYRTALKTTKVKDDIWEANIRLAMGKLLLQLKSKEALTQFIKADDLYRKKPLFRYLSGRANTLGEIAKIYESQNMFEEALKLYNDLYRIQGKVGENVLAGNTAMYLTDVFIKKQNYPDAFHYADMAKNAYYKVCRKDSLGSIYHKIAVIKKNTKSPKSAEYYILNEALSYYRAADDLKGRLKSFDFLGHLYQDQKRYSEAKWFYLQANNQARLAADTTSIVTSLINLSVVKILIGDLVLAKQDLTEAEKLSKENALVLLLVKNAKVKHAGLYAKLTPEALAANAAKSKPKKRSANPLKTSASKKPILASNPTSATIVIDSLKKEKKPAVKTAK